MKQPIHRHLSIAAALAGLLFIAVPTSSHAEPQNEDEWYDPSDWFDGNNYEYDDINWTAGAEWTGVGDQGIGDNYPRRDWDYDDYSYGGTYPYWRDTYDYDPDGNQNRARNTQLDRQHRTQQRNSVSGTVEGFREVEVRDRRGQRDQFTVVRLKLRNAGYTNVDLGRRLTLRDLDLEKGDYITVTGRNRNIGGRNVLLADYIYSDGQHHRISRTTSGRATQTAGNNRSDDYSIPKTLRGVVDSVRRTSVPGSDADHTLARVTMENGQSMIVDFGPRQSPSGLGINRGDYVSIRGTQTERNDQPILRAHRIYADGEWRNVLHQETGQSDR